MCQGLLWKQASVLGGFACISSFEHRKYKGMYWVLLKCPRCLCQGCWVFFFDKTFREKLISLGLGLFAVVFSEQFRVCCYVVGFRLCLLCKGYVSMQARMEQRFGNCFAWTHPFALGNGSSALAWSLGTMGCAGVGERPEQPESLWQPIPPAVFCWNSLQLWCQPLGSSFPSAWRSCGFWTWQLGGQEPSIGTEVLHCGCGRVRIVRGCPGGPAWCQTGTRAILECYYRAVPADPPGEVEALCSGICTTFEFIWKKHV